MAGTVRLARSDEYWCWGCRQFHKFADVPKSTVKRGSRSYCVKASHHLTKQIKERKK